MIDFHFTGAETTYACYNCMPQHHYGLLSAIAHNAEDTKMRLRALLAPSVWRTYCTQFGTGRAEEPEPESFTASWVQALENITGSMSAVKVWEMASKVQRVIWKVGQGTPAGLAVVRCYVAHLKEDGGDGYAKLGVIAEILRLRKKGDLWIEGGVKEDGAMGEAVVEDGVQENVFEQKADEAEVKAEEQE